MASGKPTVRRVFLSYTAEDLGAHADAVKRQIERLGWTVADFRLAPATSDPSVEECRKRVRECDILVVLVAHRYGGRPARVDGGDGERSYVWHEVAEAESRGIEVLRFLIHEEASWPVKQIERAAWEDLERFKAHLCRKAVVFFREDPGSIDAPALDSLSKAGERLDNRDAPRGVELLSTAPVREDDAMVRYRRWVEERHRYVRLLGFGEQFQIKLPIDEVYVPLRVSARSSGKELQREARDEQGEVAVSVEGAIHRAEELKLRGVAMLGDPGAGKTTAALRVGWQCADAVQGATSLGLPSEIVPVVLRLRSLQSKDGGLREFLQRELADQCPDDPGLGARLWKHQGLLWILDGLDEVADPKARARFSGWIEKTLADRRGDRFLVTSRYAGYEGDVVLSSGFLEVNVQPLTEPQQDEFVQRWFRTVETQIGGATAETVRTAEARRGGLIGVLRGSDFRSQRLMSMSANPLLLSILCVVYRKDQDLPRRRSELYEKCVHVLLEHWRKEWRRSAGLSPLDVRAACDILKPMAWWLQEQDNRTEAKAKELAAEAANALVTLSPEAGLGTDGGVFLKRVRDESGLLVSQVPGRYSFLHLSFQEYLAARHACDKGFAYDLADRFGASWWKEVGLLALSLGSAEFAHNYFTRLLRTDGVDLEPSLLSLALQESLHLPIEPFVAALTAKKTPPGRLALLLRCLRDRKDAAFVETAKRLAKHPDSSVAGAAVDVLLRAGIAVAPRRLVAGTTEFHTPSGVTLSYVPAGAFDMGSPARDKQSFDPERPIHGVSVPAFWLAKHPVTNEEYARFLKANPKHRVPDAWTSSPFNQPHQPVVGVSWHDAQAYCGWSGLRLPSEAEWEYACRAGTTSRYWSGNREKDLARVGWYEKNSGARLHAVGEKPASPWGLHDMHGNAFEWCEDTWHDNYDRAPTDGKAWEDSEASWERNFRGGSFDSNARHARSAYRGGYSASVRRNYIGFRPARSVTT